MARSGLQGSSMTRFTPSGRTSRQLRAGLQANSPKPRSKGNAREDKRNMDTSELYRHSARRAAAWRCHSGCATIET
jgi:hypothetical protein